MPLLSKAFSKPAILFAIPTVIFILIFYAPYFFMGYEFIAIDYSTIHLPFYKGFGEALRNGVRLYWSPNIGSGYPLSGDGHTGVFNPLINLAFYVFNWQTALRIVFFIVILLGWLGMYLFLKRIGICRSLAYLGGMSWVFSSYYMSTQLTLVISETLSLLPWSMLFVYAYIEKRQVHTLLLLMLTLGLHFLIIHPQTAVYNTLFILSFYLFAKKENIRQGRTWLVLVILLVGLVLIASPQLYSAYELKQISVRDKGWPLSLALRGAPAIEPFFSLVSPFLLNPDTSSILYETGDASWMRYLIQGNVLYVGIVLLFGIFGLIFLKRTRLESFFLVSGLLAFSLVLGRFNPLYWLMLKVPVLNNFGGTSRFAPYLLFSMIILGCYGWHRYLIDDKGVFRKRFMLTNFVFFLVYSILLLKSHFLTSYNLLQSLSNALLHKPLPAKILLLISTVRFPIRIKTMLPELLIVITIFLLVYLRNTLRISNKTLLLCILLIGFIDISWHWLGFPIYSNNKEILEGSGLVRFLKEDVRETRVLSLGTKVSKTSDLISLPPNLSAFYNLQETRPKMPLTQRLYRDIYERSIGLSTEEMMGDIDFSSINLLALTSTRYIVSPKPLKHKELSLVYASANGYIYMYPKIEEIPYFVRSIRSVENEREALDLIFTAGFSPRDTGIIQGDSPFSQSRKPASGKVLSFKALPNGVSADVIADDYSFLIFPYNYSKFIRSNMPIIKTQYAFIGVVVPKGRHCVYIEYEEGLTRHLFYLSIAAMLFISGIALYSYRRSTSRIV